MRIKTAEASGVVLDYLVAVCEKKLITLFCGVMVRNGPALTPTRDDPLVRWCPGQDWSQGGPIIERNRLHLRPVFYDGAPEWKAQTDSGMADVVETAPTPLIAAMRCYVASKLGDEAEVPDELMKEQA